MVLLRTNANSELRAMLSVVSVLTSVVFMEDYRFWAQVSSECLDVEAIKIKWNSSRHITLKFHH